MAKTLMIVSLTWSSMRSSETFPDDSMFTGAVLFIALTALVWAVLHPARSWASPDED